MSKRSVRELVVVAILASVATSAGGTGVGQESGSLLPPPSVPEIVADGESRPATVETLWIFDADFEDLEGDNAGWTSLDESRYPACPNYWHIDTIRTLPTWVGDYTWWCGTVDTTGTWHQPRGYGNNWTCYLERAFPEVDANTDPGDDLQLSWDQRWAMERNYDYGFVDISTNGGSTWITIRSFTNGGFQGYGIGTKWSLTNVNSHVVVDADPYAGQPDLRLRFRFESDSAASSADQPDNAQHSMKDGAWQIDNIKWSKGFYQPVQFWVDDCESGDVMGWVHDAFPGNQVGVIFRRAYEPETFRGFLCDAGTGWMMAAVDSVTGRTVDGQKSWLTSPPIDVSGIGGLVGVAKFWSDLPQGTSGAEWRGSRGSMPVRISAGPEWSTATVPLDGIVDPVDDSLRLHVHQTSSSEDTPGLFLDRVRVGSVVGPDRPGVWGSDDVCLLWDGFSASGLVNQDAEVEIHDADGWSSGLLVASNDGGATWHQYPTWTDPYYTCGDFLGWYQNLWFESPDELIGPATEILYYLSVTDDLGNTNMLPRGAPDDVFRVSVLPIHGSDENPGILFVNKHGQVEETPIDDRSYVRNAGRWIRQALDILGYEYDIYDTWWTGHDEAGPTSAKAYSAYDTHIWSGGFLLKTDQQRLATWLAGSTPEQPRNLLVCGVDIAWDLIDQGYQWESFFTNVLGASYEGRHPGNCPYADVPDTLVRLRDAGLGFLTYDDWECWVRCACPEMQCLNVVGPTPGSGAVTILEYDNGRGTFPAGVARVDSVTGARTVFLPFVIESLNEGLNGVNGHYLNGINDQVDLLANIMEFFGKEPSGSGTGVPEGEQYTNALGLAHPNPFNPVTTIEYEVAAPGRVGLRLYNLAGRLVRTLVDGDVEPGKYRVAWDGTTDAGDRAASGVYFVKMETPGFEASRKMILLK